MSNASLGTSPFAFFPLCRDCLSCGRNCLFPAIWLAYMVGMVCALGSLCRHCGVEFSLRDLVAAEHSLVTAADEPRWAGSLPTDLRTQTFVQDVCSSACLTHPEKVAER